MCQVFRKMLWSTSENRFDWMYQVFRKMLWSTSESRFDGCVKYLGRCCGVHLMVVLMDVSGS